MANTGDNFEINLLNSIDVDKVRKDVFDFGDKTAPHNANTGIERNGGIANIYEQEVAYSETGYHYLTEDGHVLSAEAVAGDARIIRVDGKAIGQVSSYGVQSRTEIDGYDDVALTADGTYIAIRIQQTTITITELSLANIVLNTRNVSFSQLSGVIPYFSSLSIVRYQTMHYADSQEFAIRMGDNVVLLKESTPSQFVPLGIGGSAGGTGGGIFPGGGAINAIGTYRNFLILASDNGKVSSFDGVAFRLSDGSGTGLGPWNNQTAVGTNPIVSIVEYHPTDDDYYLCIAGSTNCRIASWDGVAWKNYDSTGTGNGPFDNNTSIATVIIGTASYITRYFVVFGNSGRVGSWDSTVSAWKRYDGGGTGSGPFDNGTAIGANNILCAATFVTTFAVAGVGGRLGSWTAGVWTVYTAGAGLRNNATAVGAVDITSMASYGTTYLFIGSNNGRVATWDGANWRNYDGTGTGAGPSNNAVVVGANQVIIIPFNLYIAFFGVGNGRIGSWDGANFKNYNGTGTGTGIFSDTVANFNTINVVTTYTSANGTTVVYANTTTFSYINHLNSRAPLISVGGEAAASTTFTNVSRIIQGSSLAGYLYVYRYETVDYYLLAICGDQSNFVTHVSFTSSVSFRFFGRWVVKQVRNNVTRFIVTQTPRIASSLVAVLSIIGYRDFVTFSPGVATYPQLDTSNPPTTTVSAININSIGPTIGYNYADMTFRLSSSATDIYSLYAPQPSPTPTRFNDTRKSNTATTLNGYGKLNNALGAPTSKPFEFRAVVINGQQSALSVAMIDGLQGDAMGVLITNVGEWDETYQPQIVGDDTILYRFNGRFYIVKIGQTIADFFDKITTDLYKLNTIHPTNLYSDRDKSLYPSSMDYHGQVFFNSTAAPGTEQLVASVLSTQYSNSIDVGDKIVLINPVTSANIEVFGARIPSNYGVALPFAVDTYIQDDYSFSTLSNGIEVILPDKVDTLYIPDDRIPIALGADYFGSTAVIGGTTIILNPDYDGYIIGNDITGEFIAFVLFGQTYLFDGNFIFLAEIQANVLTNTTRIAPADGLIYIASSPTAIWFLSQFDNSLYTFEGGRNLTKNQRFTATSAIQQGVWSVRDDTLLLETVDSLIWIRDGVITQNAKKANQTSLQLFETTDGIVISNDVAKWRYTYSALAGSTVVPLSLKTAYFGVNSNMRAIAKSLIVTVYSPTRSALTITLTHDGYDQDRQYIQSEVFTITPADYTQNGYCRLRLQPKDQRTVGSSLQYDCAGYALIQEMVMIFEPEQSAIISGNRSK